MITTLDLVDDDAVPRRLVGDDRGGFDSVTAGLSDNVISEPVMPDEQPLAIGAIHRRRFEAKPERVRA